MLFSVPLKFTLHSQPCRVISFGAMARKSRRASSAHRAKANTGKPRSAPARANQVLNSTQRLFDPVVGYVPLTAEEYELCKTPVVQRLGRIRQLGLACLVFPGATHSRFSHSLGVLFQMQQMLEGLRRNGTGVFTIEEERDLRVAALLHDVGHFPLSHIGEKATADHDAEKAPPLLEGGTGKRTTRKRIHEDLSARVVLKDTYVARIIPSPKRRERIGDIIMGRSMNAAYNALLHSEFDADRLDYLLRDAHFTGVNFGRIESGALTSQVKGVKSVDSQWEIGVRSNALHDLEHYILARYFFKAHILGNPAVQLVDRLCEDIYMELIRSGQLPALERVRKWVEQNVNHEFYAFTDDRFLAKTRRLHERLSRKAQTRYSCLDWAARILMDGGIPSFTWRKSYRKNRVEWQTQREQVLERVKDAIRGVCRNGNIDPSAIVYVTKDVDIGRSSLSLSAVANREECKDAQSEYMEAAKVIEDPSRIGLAAAHPASLLKEAAGSVLVSSAFFLLDKHRSFGYEGAEARRGTRKERERRALRAHKELVQAVDQALA